MNLTVHNRLVVSFPRDGTERHSSMDRDRRRGPVLTGCLAFLIGTVLPGAGAALDQTVDESKPPLKSGLQAGEKVPTFYVRAITGPHQNKSVCYVCRNGDRPVVMVLVREITPELSKLLKGIDTLVDRHRGDGLRSFGVFVPREGSELLPRVQTLAFDGMIHLPLTIAAAPADGPAGQNLHPDAATTVILYREQKVIANFAYRAGELQADQINAILKSVAQLATSEKPTGAAGSPARKQDRADGCKSGGNIGH